MVKIAKACILRKQGGLTMWFWIGVLSVVVMPVAVFAGVVVRRQMEFWAEAAALSFGLPPCVSGPEEAASQGWAGPHDRGDSDATLSRSEETLVVVPARQEMSS